MGVDNPAAAAASEAAGAVQEATAAVQEAAAAVEDAVQEAAAQITDPDTTGRQNTEAADRLASLEAEVRRLGEAWQQITAQVGGVVTGDSSGMAQDNSPAVEVPVPAAVSPQQPQASSGLSRILKTFW